MRVLLINDHARAYGGAELMMFAHRERLEAAGHSVRIFASRAEMLPGFPFLGERGCYGRDDTLQVALQSANPTAWLALKREMAEYPPNVVHIRSFLWQLSPTILPALRGVPVFHQAPTYKEICPNGLKMLPDLRPCDLDVSGPRCRDRGCVSPRTFAADRLQKALLHRWRDAIDVTAVLNQQAAQFFRAAGWTEVEVVPNPAMDRAAIAAPVEARPIVAYAGRLAREKGVDTLIDAFALVAAQIPEAELLILGDGPDAAALKDRAAATGARVVFGGHVAADQVDARLRSAWVQAVPSLWHEPFGNVCLEAMMRGTAVIGSDRGAIPDIILDAGRVVPAGDVAAWRDALFALLSDRALCLRLGQAGRLRAETNFSQSVVFERILSLYDLAAQRFRGRQKGMS